MAATGASHNAADYLPGDTYVRSVEGSYTCLGRNSDMLKAGGIRVSPAEVESRLLEHPAVTEAAVVGVADENGLDKPVAVVVVSHASGEDLTEEDLVSWCRDGLAHFKAPRKVVFATELPRTATGKLQRFRVRDLVTERPVADPTAELEVAP
jgi:acyl-coenzyme A synthetase/AMP-(fatty) acid ligase